MCVCVVIPFILDVRLADVPAGVTQEEGHTGFLHLPSAVLALIFLVRRIQPFLSLVDREVDFCLLTNQSFSTCLTMTLLFPNDRRYIIVGRSTLLFVVLYFIFLDLIYGRWTTTCYATNPTHCNVAILPVVTKYLPISPRFLIFYCDASSALL